MKARYRYGSLLLYFWGVGMICSTIAGDWPDIGILLLVFLGTIGAFLWIL